MFYSHTHTENSLKRFEESEAPLSFHFMARTMSDIIVCDAIGRKV